MVSTRIAVITGKHQPFEENEDVKEFSMTNSKTAILPYEIGKNFPNLVNFIAMNCHLRFINRNMFQDMSKLELLKLDHNEIEILSPFVFNELKNLKWLSLNDNNIPNLPSQVFSNLKRLSWVTINDNFLTKLDDNIFINNTRIELMSFKGNQLKEILVDFDSFKKLLYVDFRHNDCANSNFRKIELGRKLFYLTIKEELKNCGIMKIEEKDVKNF
ncbi:hypothetical protein PVAND_016979 [Polypedilum vanderplanki]|uniref:Uncharacterized protein n=1 Tax=Polypedilum vanderplanki TaxID=319348 RepID=A0A9J6BHD6_POLVA|nr:hypothetical protein PVAND_016979 [Polypedilum vanderplanki]